MIQESKYVEMSYTLKGKDGDILDSSPNFAYIHGQGLIIPGLEKHLEGKNEGNEVSVDIPSAEAYGDYNADLRFEVNKAEVEGSENFQEGMFVYGQDGEHYHVFRVVSIDDSKLILDGNHPLAGLDLFYEIKILKVRQATQEDFEKLMGEEECGGGCCEDTSTCKCR